MRFHEVSLFGSEGYVPYVHITDLADNDYVIELNNSQTDIAKHPRITIFTDRAGLVHFKNRVIQAYEKLLRQEKEDA